MSFAHSPKIVTDGLVLALDAGNAKSYVSGSTTWFDLSSNRNHVILYNSPTFSTGSLNFDGIDDYGVTQNNLNLSNTDSITIEVFLKTTAVSKMILEHSTNWNYNNAFGMLITPDADIAVTGQIDFTDHTTSGYNIVASNSILNNNQWVNFTVTTNRSNSSTNQSQIYINGVLDSYLSPANRTDLTGNFSSFPLYIASRAGNSFFYSGGLSIIRMYNRALSASEVSQNFNAIRGRFGI